MKKHLFLILFAVLSYSGFSQSLIGSWQLVKQTSCIDTELADEDETVQGMIDDMKSRNDQTPQVLRFKDSKNGDESTKILNQKRSSNTRNFLYKFNGTSLYILDKKSQIIVDTFTVDVLQGDSLVISNAARPCETKVFVKLK
jgi:hypothetical protein